MPSPNKGTLARPLDVVFATGAYLHNDGALEQRYVELVCLRPSIIKPNKFYLCGGGVRIISNPVPTTLQTQQKTITNEPAGQQAIDGRVTAAPIVAAASSSGCLERSPDT